MATIRRHQGHLIIDWRDSNGKRHFERVPGDDRAKAKKRLGEILKSGEKAVIDGTFKDYGDNWLAGKKGELSETTYEEYEAVLRNHIYPVLGTKLFSKITKPMIRELITAKRGEGYEPATIRNMLAPVRGMYNQAIEDGETVGNPAAKFGKSNRKRSNSNINPYSKEEVSEFLKKALTAIPGRYPLYLCAVRTGIRRGELLVLKRSDIDFENRLIHVQRSLARHGKIKKPKSGKTRLVDMSAQLSKVLFEMGA